MYKKNCCMCRVVFLLIRKKKCAASAKLCFLLSRSIVVVFTVPVAFKFSITRFYIFFEESVNIKESFAFIRG